MKPLLKISKMRTCFPGKLMLKANALYRDGSKLSQPLNSMSDVLEELEEEEGAEDTASGSG
jgi:ribonucleoside-diphosphate reductase alpha chain